MQRTYGLHVVKSNSSLFSFYYHLLSAALGFPLYSSKHFFHLASRQPHSSFSYFPWQFHLSLLGLFLHITETHLNPGVPQSFITYLHSLRDTSKCHGFKYLLNGKNSHIYITHPDTSPGTPDLYI